MRKIFIYGMVLALLSCSGVKKTQEALNSGNYWTAINKAISNLAQNKSKKSNQPFVVMLEDAFKKNMERELKHINFLKKEGNPANFEEIFKTYEKLKEVQERIRPLLPLRLNEENRKAQFVFKSYDAQIIAVKDDLADYLYANASSLLASAQNKMDYRKAYDDFNYLQEISPNYKDTRQKTDEAYQNGLDYVIVSMFNNTDKIIPARLEEELLNFNTYGLNQKWTEYHTNAVATLNYDYKMEVAFQDITISPEQVSEKQIIKEKQVKDGYTYVQDQRGNVVKDSLGNKIRTDKFKTVRADFYQFTQFKSVSLSGMVNFIDVVKQQQINQYPLTSNFVFEHNYANYDGDKRALDNDLLSLLQLARVPFPTNEQMVYDAGEDLKNNLKQILVRHRFN